ncbi:MAG TPA: hypothetical protein VGQ89_05610 [Candidatus Limnocylindrales bacterium]|jgi:hypothetical protein|nr:hypothetical protein [Candidatus Limnocylindrales bacterium]
MTDERTRERDPRTDAERAKERPENDERPGSEEEDPNPWTREGPDAPDAADIEEPDEQR